MLVRFFFQRTAHEATCFSSQSAFIGDVHGTDVDGSGVVDHVAFRATDLEGTLSDLSAKGIEYNTRQVNDQGLFQVFLMDPNGVKVELNFDNAEAAGIDAAVKATDLPH